MMNKGGNYLLYERRLYIVDLLSIGIYIVLVIEVYLCMIAYLMVFQV